MEVPLFVSEDTLRLRMPAGDGRSIAKVRADRTSKTSAKKWDRSSFLESTHADNKFASSKCEVRRPAPHHLVDVTPFPPTVRPGLHIKCEGIVRSSEQ